LNELGNPAKKLNYNPAVPPVSTFYNSKMVILLYQYTGIGRYIITNQLCWRTDTRPVPTLLTVEGKNISS
jgi:hypothetical protein